MVIARIDSGLMIAHALSYPASTWLIGPKLRHWIFGQDGGFRSNLRPLEKGLNYCFRNFLSVAFCFCSSRLNASFSRRMRGGCGRLTCYWRPRRIQNWLGSAKIMIAREVCGRRCCREEMKYSFHSRFSAFVFWRTCSFPVSLWG